MPAPVSLHRIVSLLERELEIDGVADDVTTRLLGTEGEARRRAVVLARDEGTFCGEAACEGFALAARGRLAVKPALVDGARYRAGVTLVELEGTISDILSYERTLLNLVSHLCGVASLTRRFVDAVAPLPTKVLATRKTLPGLRDLQLMAVRAGGGWVHRRSLSDGILVKDNHLANLGEAEIVRRARDVRSPLHRVELEAQSLEQLDRILVNPPDVVMLDNMDRATMAEAIRRIAGRCEIEVSGGITLATVRAVAELGVHYVSVGALTHSAPSANLTLDFVA